MSGKKRLREKETGGGAPQGEYDRYYSYRVSKGDDPRMKLLEKSWFVGAKVKDVGCNTGRLTMNIAKRFEPRCMLGVDIDPSLIAEARSAIERATKDHAVKRKKKKLRLASSTDTGGGISSLNQLPYPLNVSFEVEDYAASSDESGDMTTGGEEHSYDVICAFSITKWVHLSYGDQGLLRFFRRALNSLKPGGRFIVEPQDWRSYKRAKAKNRQSKTIAHHLSTIQIRPLDFPTILTSPEVGFESVDSLGRPDDDSLPDGFRRPIYCANKKKLERCMENQSPTLDRSAAKTAPDTIKPLPSTNAHSLFTSISPTSPGSLKHVEINSAEKSEAVHAPSPLLAESS